MKSLFVSHKLLRFCRDKLDPLIGVAFCYHWSSVRPVASDCQVNFPLRSISPLKRLSDFPFRTSNDTPLKAGTIRFPAHRAVTKDNSGEASVLRVWNKIAGAAFPPFPSEILDTRGFTLKWSEVGAVRRELCGGWVSWGGIRTTLMLTGILPVARPFFFLSPLVPYSLSCPPDPQSEEDLSGQSSEIPKVWQVWGLASLSTDTSVQLWAFLPLWRWWCHACVHVYVCLCVRACLCEGVRVWHE